MGNLTHDEICARQQQLRQSLIVLNGNRERDRLLFWVALGVGLFVLILMSAILRGGWIGLLVFTFVEAVLGVPGFVGWQRAESKIARIQTALAELERMDVDNPGVAAREHRPNPLKITAARCNSCGKELVGVGAFCQSCGARQREE